MTTGDEAPAAEPALEHVDVLVVGAGLSGVGAACHLQRECPEKSVLLLEARDAIGGTWDLFRYPGVRSDSDMYTLGYAFRPWTSAKAIADGPSILAYVRETARAYGVDRRVRYGHRVVRAEWSSATARWTVTAELTSPAGTEGASPSPRTVRLSCSFLSVCSGYYRYDAGYTPAIPGLEEFTGRVVHPQHWPDDLDHTGQQVVIVGSGATAVTLVPAMADRAARVTMLQRSPTYIAAVPSEDRTAARLRRLLPERLAYPLVRWKSVLLGVVIFQLSRRRPALVRALLRKSAIAQLPAGYDVDTHLAPSYDPWDQRLCAAPDGDLFRALRSGRAEIVTDTIDRVTPSGVRLASGRELPADLLVLATGLNLLAIGAVALVVDGHEVSLPDTLTYKGMMLAGVPNFALTVGYTNASWTLRADLAARYVVRLLRHLDRHGYQTVTPVPPDPAEVGPGPSLLDLSAGYVRRGEGLLPRQGSAAPWQLPQNYLRDVLLMRRGRVTDGVRFGYAGQPVQVLPAEGRADGPLPVR